jgi:peptidoglycan/LPS O-acetylase OafA/YrhL
VSAGRPAIATTARDRQPQSSERFEGLEAYRGIAALLIVIFHSYQFTREGTGRATYVYDGTWLDVVLRNLEAGVACFFVLSGFLIFLPFARAALGDGAVQSGRGFLVRRAIRIIPAYYVAILIVWTWRYTGSPGQWRDLFLHLTFTHIFSQQYIFSIIGPSWSLAVEVLFYLFLAFFGPLMWLLCSRLAGYRARLAVLAGTTALLVIASLVYKWWAAFVAHIPETQFPAYFGPLAKLDTFAFGMLLAILVAARRGRAALRAPLLALLVVAGGAVLAFAFAFRMPNSVVAAYFHTLSGVAFLCILAATVLGSQQSRWNRTLSLPPLQYLGMISYSLYLWHEPIMLELGYRNLLIREIPRAFPLNALLLCLFSVAVASLVYALIERPTLNARYLFRRDGRLVDYYPAETQRQAKPGHAA